MIAALALLLLGQSVGLRLSDSTRVPPEQVQSIMAELREALKARAPSGVSILPPGSVSEPQEVVQVALIGGLTRTRVVAERIGNLGKGSLRSEIDLGPDTASWGPELATMARRLFPEPTLEQGRPAEPESGRDLLPMVAGLALGVTFGGLGLALDLRGQQIEQDTHSMYHPPTEIPELDARASHQRTIGAVGIALGAALLLGTAAWFVLN
jgi:hypothetical protein